MGRTRKSSRDGGPGAPRVFLKSRVQALVAEDQAARARHGANCRDAELEPVSSRWPLELMEGPLQCLSSMRKEHFFLKAFAIWTVPLAHLRDVCLLNCSVAGSPGQVNPFALLSSGCFSVKETSILQEAFDI